MIQNKKTKFIKLCTLHASSQNYPKVRDVTQGKDRKKSQR